MILFEKYYLDTVTIVSNLIQTKSLQDFWKVADVPYSGHVNQVTT